MNTIPKHSADGRRRRRIHSAEFKAETIAACMTPGVSIAAVAMGRGINANLLRRWLKVEEERAGNVAPPEAPTNVQVQTNQAPGFLPLALPAVAPAVPSDIRIELRRGATSVSVMWPTDATAECAAWMRELLR